MYSLLVSVRRGLSIRLNLTVAYYVYVKKGDVPRIDVHLRGLSIRLKQTVAYYVYVKKGDVPRIDVHLNLNTNGITG